MSLIEKINILELLFCLVYLRTTGSLKRGCLTIGYRAQKGLWLLLRFLQLLRGDLSGVSNRLEPLWTAVSTKFDLHYHLPAQALLEGSRGNLIEVILATGEPTMR